MLSIIAAKSKNSVIGYKGDLPWKFSSDFKWFKKTTMGGTLIVGRLTYESMGSLPGRDCIVISSQDLKTVKCARSVKQAIEKADPNKPIFLAGGTRVFKEGLELIDTLYLTIIDKDYEGDAFFPGIPWSNFKIVDSFCVEEKGVSLRFIKAVKLPA